MSHLFNKSNSNLKVAQDLYPNPDLCCASVHCSYYSCFQLIKHLLMFVIMPYYTLPHKDAHKEAHLRMMNALGQVDPNSAFKFNNEYKDLQGFRTESDYENVVATPAVAERAYKKAVSIRTTITSIFAP